MFKSHCCLFPLVNVIVWKVHGESRFKCCCSAANHTQTQTYTYIYACQFNIQSRALSYLFRSSLEYPKNDSTYKKPFSILDIAFASTLNTSRKTDWKTKTDQQDTISKSINNICLCLIFVHSILEWHLIPNYYDIQLLLECGKCFCILFLILIFTICYLLLLLLSFLSLYLCLI